MAIADGGDMAVEPWEPGGGRPWRRLAPPKRRFAASSWAELVGHALRVGGASVVPPGPAAARRAPDTLLLGLIRIRWQVVALKARVK